MKKNCFYVFLVLLAILRAVTPARAQAVEELELSISRDFGSSDGTGNIQGTFSMKVTGPSNLVKVKFYIDNTMIAENTEPPFKVQFVTDDYAPGKHTMHAIGYTSDGRELRTREMTFNYMTAEESWQRGLKIAVPILALALIWVLFSRVVPTLSRGRKKGDLLPPGGHNYGFIGGTICPRCAHPFALNFFSPNLLVGKLVCCPNCGKWFIGRRASIDDLRIAEEAAWRKAHSAPQFNEIFSAIWACKHPVGLWRESQSIFHHRNARGNKPVVADQGIPPGYLPTRFIVSGASIWNAGGIHAGFAMLCDFTDDYIGQNANGKYLGSREKNCGSKNHHNHCSLLFIRVL